MPLERIRFGSFNSGMISTTDFTGSATEARDDLKMYYSGARNLQNFYALAGGAAMKRPGCRYVDRNDALLRIAPFVFSEGQTYIFAFKSSGTMDVYRCDSGLPVLTAANVGHPWGPPQLVDLRWCYRDDTWIGFHYDVPPTQIVRNSDASWTVSSIPFSPVIQEDFGSGLEDCISNTRGWPVTGCFHQDRLVMGGTPSMPGTVFGTVVGEYTNMTQNIPSQDDDAFIFFLASDVGMFVRDLQSVNGMLMVNCDAGEWIEQSQPLTPSSVDFQLTTVEGILNTGIRPVNISNGNSFIDKHSSLRLSLFNELTQQYEAQDLSVLVPGLLANPTASTYAKKFLNNSNLLLFRQASMLGGGNGLAVLTYEFTQQIRAWSQWYCGANFGFLDVCGLDDQIYVLIQDDIDNRVHLCHLDNQIYMDVWATATSGSPTTSFGGFGQLATFTVRVLDNQGGQYDGIVVDSGGNITVPNPVTAVWVGIPYDSQVVTMPLAPMVQGQLMRGEEIRKVYADLILRNTGSLTVDGQYISLKDFGPLVLDQFTNEVNTTMRVWLDGIDTEPVITIECNDSMPMVLLGLVAGVKVRNPAV
jgi:hypothetical protein